MLTRSRLVRWGLWIGLASALLATLGWGLFQPWAANHFGYALPGQDRLPYRITYQGRDYSNPNECAGDTWCQPSAKTCTSKQQLQNQNFWPLTQVGTIPTLFGAAYPILAPPNAETFIFVLDDDDCYLIYALEGGP